MRRKAYAVVKQLRQASNKATTDLEKKKARAAEIDKHWYAWTNVPMQLYNEGVRNRRYGYRRLQYG
jgi:hypothetical protein